MKGSKEVIDSLNMLLKGELTAINQYFLHSEMLKNWGLINAFEQINHEIDDETGHARKLIQRILFLEGTPELGQLENIFVGSNIQEMYEFDLKYEMTINERLKNVIETCEKHHDYGTREILVTLLEDTEEDHIRWLEIQLDLIKKVGIENYLQTQIRMGQ